MDKKSEFFTYFVIKSIEQFPLDFTVLINWVNLWMYLYPCNGKVYFSGIVLNVQQMQPWYHSLWICTPSALHSFLNSPANSVPLPTQKLLRRFFFVIIVKNSRTVSLESFVFIPFVTTVLSNKSWWTRSYFTLFLSLVSLSTYAESIQ